MILLRAIRNKVLTGYQAMSWSEAVLNGVWLGVSPETVMTWAWLNPCVSVGKFQDYQEVNTEYCDAWGIDYVRRETGGSGVLHPAYRTRKQLTYARVGKLPDELAREAVKSGVTKSVFQFACNPVLEACKVVGLEEADFAEGTMSNDIRMQGKKISGNAIYVTPTGRYFLLQGVINLAFTEADIETMATVFRLDTTAKEKARSVIGSVCDFKRVSYEKLEKTLIEKFAGDSKVQASDGLSDVELKNAASLERSKYRAERWWTAGKHSRGVCFMRLGGTADQQLTAAATAKSD